MQLVMNGQERTFEALGESSTVADLIAELGLKGDRIAVEHNGEIVPRGTWQQALLADGDKIEVVHFVGGGAG
jgi:sulfur carrier protein